MDFKRIQTIAFFALLIGVAVLFYQMIEPYVFALFWAAVIASIFFPVYERLRTRLKQENVSAALTVVLAILVVLIPLSGVFGIVVAQAVNVYDHLENDLTRESVRASIEGILQHPTIYSIVGDVDVQQYVDSISTTISERGLEWLKAGSQSTLSWIVSLLVMLYSLYYFLKDGKQWLKHLMHLLPFGDKNEKILYEKFASTARATLKGTILLGTMQGTIGGVLFWIAGVPGSAFWGLIMIVLSIIPAVGSFVVLVPGAIYLFAVGDIWQAVMVLIGSGVVGMLDNVLRPILVGKDIQMHPMIILFATIGGLGFFGISGVVVGPIIAAFFFAVLQMYETKYKRQLDSAST